MKEGFSFVFENFIYVPIVSALIGALLSVVVPKIGTMVWERIKKLVIKKLTL